MGRVRIIGGINRSRILKFADGVSGLRPTPDRVRETLFNWLGQDLTGKSCLDAYAGSGALGFEAASRNAKSVVMIDNNKSVAQDLEANKALLHVDNVVIRNESAINYLRTTQAQFDVIFLDPPYASVLLSESLQIIRKRFSASIANRVAESWATNSVLKPHGLVYVEYQHSNSKQHIIQKKMCHPGMGSGSSTLDMDFSGYTVLKETKAGIVHAVLLQLNC